MMDLCAVRCLALGLGLAACNGHARSADASATSAAFRYVLVEGPYVCSTGKPDPDMAATIARDREALLKALGNAATGPLTSRAAVMQAFAARDGRPTVVLYSGHGRCSRQDPSDPTRCAPDAHSELCLKDGTLAVDTLIASIQRETPYAVIALDACWSANVDPRLSPVPLAVLSASANAVRTRDSATALGPALTHALTQGDANLDGLVDDDELLCSVLEFLEARCTQVPAGAAVPERPTLVPLPRLRRQAWSPLPVARVARRQAEEQLPPSLESIIPAATRDDMLRAERAFAEGRSAAWSSKPRVACIPLAQAPSDALLLAAQSIRGTALFAFFPDPVSPATRLVWLQTKRTLAVTPAGGAAEACRAAEDGDWSTIDDTMRGTQVWHGGVVGERVVSEGRSIASRELRATPCLEPFGQCFTRAEKGPAK